MDFEFLSKTRLFSGSSPAEIEEMTRCLKAEQRAYEKGSMIYHAGDTAPSLGMVISGSVNIENDDVWGNKSILDNIGPGQVFAETYACVPKEPLMVNVVAAEHAVILFLHTSRLLNPCPTACPHHNRLIRSLLTVTAEKNLILSRRIFHTSSKSIRGRLVSYLSFQARYQNSHEFSIPFNRQQLADYLGVDRSAMSNELSKMQKDGLLTVCKNKFSIKMMIQ